MENKDKYILKPRSIDLIKPRLLKIWRTWELKQFILKECKRMMHHNGLTFMQAIIDLKTRIADNLTPEEMEKTRIVYNWDKMHTWSIDEIFRKK